MNKTTARKLLSEERTRLERVRGGVVGELGDPAEEHTALAETSGVDQHPADVGTERFERDKDMSIVAGIDAELVDIESALRRLEHGAYGTCEVCGRPIGEARLRARPATRYCIKDQVSVERQVRSAS